MVTVFLSGIKILLYYNDNLYIMLSRPFLWWACSSAWSRALVLYGRFWFEESQRSGVQNRCTIPCGLLEVSAGPYFCESSIVVSIWRCQRCDPGSSPGSRTIFLIIIWFFGFRGNLVLFYGSKAFKRVCSSWTQMKRSSRRWKKKGQMRWKWQRKRMKKERKKRQMR